MHARRGADKRRHDFPASHLSKGIAVETEGEGDGDREPEQAKPPADEQSAAALLRRLADVIAAWRSQLPPEVQPALIAILHGGIQLDVERLSNAGFHDIQVEASSDFRRGPQCLVFVHQATVHLVLYVQKIAVLQPEQLAHGAAERPQRLIGFVIDGEAFKV